MGGIGSGRRFSMRPTLVVENRVCIKMTELKKYQSESFIRFEWNSDDSEYSEYSAGIYRSANELYIVLQEDDQFYPQTVELQTMACAFGGERQWLICPKCGCQRMTLYIGKNSQFTCRCCNKLGYRSQKRVPAERLLYNAEKLRRKAEQPPIFGDVVKHKGMHMTTYQKLQKRIYHYEYRSHELFKAMVCSAITKNIALQ